jgi:hypothetical protein
MAGESNIRRCPFCKEEIRADAIRCKHCRSSIAPEQPAHQGTCPYCKEAIHPEAIKCKHCGSAVGPSQGCEGCSGTSASTNVSARGPGAGDVEADLPPGFTSAGPLARVAALGCTDCRPVTAWDMKYGTGRRTCTYLVCTKIGNFTHCQVVSSTEFCGRNPIWDIFL